MEEKLFRSHDWQVVQRSSHTHLSHLCAHHSRHPPQLHSPPSLFQLLHRVLELQDAVLLVGNRLVPPRHAALQRRHVAPQPLSHRLQPLALRFAGPMGGLVQTRRQLSR